MFPNLLPARASEQGNVIRLVSVYKLIRKQEGMVQRLGEMRKDRRERIEKGSREGIEKETKRQFEEKEGLRDPPLLEFLDPRKIRF